MLEITPEQHARARAAFEAVIDAAVSPTRMGQLELFTDEEEIYLAREVERMLWEPKLPNAGARERKWVQQLRQLARDESLVVALKMAAARYASAMEKCLPMREYVRRGNRWVALPGCYYSRRPLLRTSNKALCDAAMELKLEAASKREIVKRWFADFILEGMPVPVSNFKMECLYIMQTAEGNMNRLVRLTNIKGETSDGQEIAGADLLPNEMYAGSEKFRQWVSSRGNFAWGCEGGAGNTELQLLQRDVTEDAAFRRVRLMQHCGWHELKQEHLAGVVDPNKLFLSGLWFYEGAAAGPDGKWILPDADGIYWHNGEGYALSSKGRELEYTHGLPRMQLDVQIQNVELDTSDWDPLAARLYTTKPLAGFFREITGRFFDTAGGYEGWMAVGAVLGYVAAPEIFERHGMLPSLWVSGQMGSGKTRFTSWLMSFAGFISKHINAGMGLISKSVTGVGMMCQLENYSNIPVWFDEYRQSEITPDKSAILRDQYNRQMAEKWSPGGVQRKIRTSALVSGESTTSDAATRSRYPHVLLSEQKRLANHLEWMGAHHGLFFLVWRELMERRREFVERVLRQIEFWMDHPDLKGVPSRERITHSVCYAAFVAAAETMGSHVEEEFVAYRRFMTSHSSAAAEDVKTDVNVNVFFQELLTATQADAIPLECYRVERVQLKHPPCAPNQGPWDSYKLFIEPNLTISSLQIYLRKGNQNVTLRLKDLRDQLSKTAFWIKSASRDGWKKRFGRKGSLVTKTAWGIDLDKHHLGYRMVTDEELAESMMPDKEKPLGCIGVMFRDGDPRKGGLYDIIERVLAAERREDDRP